MGSKLYYIDFKSGHKGVEIGLKVTKVRAIYGNKVNGKIPVACCFDCPSKAIELLERAVDTLKNDTTTQLIQALHDEK
jgi:hypothetical protein